VEEVAATIFFLASPDNRVTRGAIVPAYGKSSAPSGATSQRVSVSATVRKNR
jgi:hypothetical protein